MLISGMGVPGCGKSTVIRALADLLSIDCFLEPEEEQWTEAITEREQLGYFNCIHAFRGLRVPNLLRAAEISSAGETIFVDTFYDKLCCHWLGRPGTEWLLKPEDPYFANFVQTAWLDYRYLPEADVVVPFEVKRDDWAQMLNARGRKLDAATGLHQIFILQCYLSEAVRRYESDRQGATKIVSCSNSFGQLPAVVESLRASLTALGAIK